MKILVAGGNNSIAESVSEILIDSGYDTTKCNIDKIDSITKQGRYDSIIFMAGNMPERNMKYIDIVRKNQPHAKIGVYTSKLFLELYDNSIKTNDCIPIEISFKPIEETFAVLLK